MTYTGIILGFVCISVLTMYSLRKIPQWEQREFVNMKLSWTKTIWLSFIVGLISSFGVIALGGSWWQIPLIAILGWMVPFVTVSDYSTYKIPMESSILAYLIPLPIVVFFVFSSKAALVSLGLWIAMPVIFLFVAGLLLRGGFGMADTRLLLLAGTTLSWWVGYDWMLYALGTAAGLQFIVIIFLAVTGGGRVKRYGLDEVAVNKSEVDKDDTAKKRKVSPFGPSLIVSFWILGFIAVYFERTACSPGNGIFCIS